MDANGEGAPRSAPENTVKGGEVDKPSNHEEGRATYRSFKYVSVALLCRLHSPSNP